MNQGVARELEKLGEGADSVKVKAGVVLRRGVMRMRDAVHGPVGGETARKAWATSGVALLGWAGLCFVAAPPVFLCSAVSASRVHMLDLLMARKRTKTRCA